MWLTQSSPNSYFKFNLMKNLTLLVVLLSFQSFLLAQCLPPSASAELDINNAIVRLNNSGSSWWDGQSDAQYEIPSGSGKHSFFAQSIWIGGVDQNNQIHLAAMRFGQVGNDFYPGPIGSNGTVTANDCAASDRIYKLNRSEVEEFIDNYNESWYTVPTDILEWPATGNPYSLVDANAPFNDVNNDGVYNPDDGDYPAFAVNEPLDKDFHLMGDQCLWWVINDVGGPHGETGGLPLGVELQCMAYAFATCDTLNDQTLYRYKAINKSSDNYVDTYLGLWVDSDIGFADDDYVGSDVMRNLCYTYNGLAIDGTGGPAHYGANPPAAGVSFLQGPFAEPNDGLDNDRDGTVDEPDERVAMSAFMYHNNLGPGPQSDPQNAADYYNYMRAIWLDGAEMCYGGGGHPNSGCNVGVTTNFMFPGDSDPLGYSTGGVPQAPWTEQTAGNVPFDRRFIMSMGPFTFSPSEEKIVHFGALWARSLNASDPYESVEALKQVADHTKEKFDNDFQTVACCPPTAEIAIDAISEYDFQFAAMQYGTSYYWSFGDGQSSTERYPNHTYTDYGTYLVCLTVQNGCGSDNICEAVTILAPPVSVRLQRIEGQGNMGRTLEFVEGTHDSLLVSNRIYHPIYEFNQGPVRVEVLDSTLLPTTEMAIALDGTQPIYEANWKMYPLGGNDTVYSTSTIQVGAEQLIPQWGLLVQMKQVSLPNEDCESVLDCSIEESADPWLRFLSDLDGSSSRNWIRSGTENSFTFPEGNDYGDDEECYEGIIGGTWAPWKLASHEDSVVSPTWKKFKSLNDLGNLHSVDIVITPNQDLWTRCPVVEIADDPTDAVGNAERFNLRMQPSVNKNGSPDGSGTMGMSWFPGYAVSLETGERLNMAFGENSSLQPDNGGDMIWNPTSSEQTGFEEIFGGGHYIYVFGHNGDDPDDVPFYDEASFIYSILSENNFDPGDPSKRRVYKDAMWVSIPLLEDGHTLLESEVTVKLRVRWSYMNYQCLGNVVNGTRPLYYFDPSQIGVVASISKRDNINVNIYPNPTSELVHVHNDSEVTLEEIELYDIQGNLLLKQIRQLQPNERINLNVGELPSGIYYLVLRTKENGIVKKLVKN